MAPSRRWLLAVAGTTLVLAGIPGRAGAAPTPTTTPARLSTVRAAPAAAFLDSLGVATHVTYTDTPYRDLGRTITLLHQLGVAHIRDGIAAHSPSGVSAIAALGRAGIHSTLVVGGDGSGLKPPGPVLSELHGLAPYIDAIEGPNEYDTSGASDWPAVLRARR